MVPNRVWIFALVLPLGSAIADEAPHALTEWRDLVQHATEQQVAGNYAQAETALGKALAFAETLADKELAVPVTYNNLGMLYGETGRRREAERAYKTAVAGLESLGTASIGLLVTPIANLVALYLENGQLSRAAAEMKRFESFPEAEMSDSNRVRLHTSRGRILQTHGKLAECEEEYRRALAIAENSPTVPRLDFANSLNNLATVEADLENFDAAREHLQRTIETYESVIGPQSPRLILPLTNLGVVVARGHKRPADALPYFQRAVDLAEQTLGPDAAETGRVLAHYARALRACGRKQDAKIAEARANRIEQATGTDAFGRYTVDINTLRERR